MDSPSPKQMKLVLDELHSRGVQVGPAVRIHLSENAPKPAATPEEVRASFFSELDAILSTGAKFRAAFAQVKARRPADYALIFGGE